MLIDDVVGVEIDDILLKLPIFVLMLLKSLLSLIFSLLLSKFLLTFGLTPEILLYSKLEEDFEPSFLLLLLSLDYFIDLGLYLNFILFSPVLLAELSSNLP